MGKKLGSVRSGDSKPKWEDAVEFIDFRDGKDHKLRLVGDFTLMARHWVVTKKGKFFPIWSPKFNEDSERLDLDNPDPMYDDFNKWPQVMLICNAIDRELQKRNDPNPVRGVMLPASSVTPILKKLMSLIDAEVSDPKHGVDLLITNNPKAPGNQKWTIVNGSNSPLTPEEKAYDYYDFDEITPDFTDSKVALEFARDMKDGMGRNYYYVTQITSDVDPDDPWESFKSDVNGVPYITVPELEGFPKPGDKDGGKKTSSRRRSSSDDEELPTSRRSRAAAQDDDDEPEFPPRNKAKKAAAESSGDQVHPDIPDMEHPDFGTVPECFTQFDGTKKCKACPVMVKCLDNSEDEDDTEI